jgi:hypothetical protein
MSATEIDQNQNLRNIVEHYYHRINARDPDPVAAQEDIQCALLMLLSDKFEELGGNVGQLTSQALITGRPRRLKP